MKKKIVDRIGIVGIVFVSLCFLITSANAVIEISDCTDCSVDGETYLLNQSIINSAYAVLDGCMNISGNNITFDGQGHTIDGINTGFVDGIYITRTPEVRGNVTVRNVVITDWEIGIYLNDANNCSFENIIISSISHIGFYLHSNSNNITNITMRDNYGSADNSHTLQVDSRDYNIINNSNFENNTKENVYICEGEYNRFYNNVFNGTNNVSLGGDDFCAGKTNYWNTTKQLGTNIADSTNPYIGGNYWGNPSGTGYSDTCVDSDNDGFCDVPYSIAMDNTDFLPISFIAPPLKIYYNFTKATDPISFTKSKEFDNFTGNESWDNFTHMVETMYTDVLGNVFYLVIFGIPILMLWLRQENVIMPIVMGLIVGVAGFSLLPPEYHVIGMTFLGLSFAAIAFTIFKSRR